MQNSDLIILGHRLQSREKRALLGEINRDLQKRGQRIIILSKEFILLNAPVSGKELLFYD
ncbi:hypothetical protein [Pseudoramibacter alactolyticus]|uniref:hypothetical protein n=1 Tax=Pseudoramibacter alactolyticus TaxID=113287 RepID=UPI002352CD4F|nr:hypothetical protein [Pseudoramibacter alactolyticus]MBM6967884.1 hypothetical protein [Pseudoramibacter alactolyticus]